MNIVRLLFLPMICFLGIVTSWEDFFTSRIRNKWVAIGLIYAFAIYILSLIFYHLSLNLDISFITSLKNIFSCLLWNFDKWCINLIISIIVAYSLWYYKMWGAGDAKLFITYVALIPMSQYQIIYFNYYFASLFLLLGIFIPVTLFLILRSIIYFAKRVNFEEIRNKAPKSLKDKLFKLDKPQLAKTIFGFFVLFLFFRILRQDFQNLLSKIIPSEIILNQNTLMLITLIVFRSLSRIFRKNLKFVSIIFIALMIYLGFKMFYLQEQFVLNMAGIFGRVILIMILFPIFRKIIGIHSEEIVQKTMPFAIWLFLGALITWFI